MEKEKHFVLVHGTCHGAWCWYKLLSLLKLAGHRATALDLGASGINPKQLNEVSSVSDYIQPLMDFMASLPQEEQVILVGHSYAGFCISLAMESFPRNILVAVFLTAYMPHHKSPPVTLIREDLELAKMLMRPTRMYMDDFSKEGLLTKSKFGSVSRVFVVCEDDEVRWFSHAVLSVFSFSMLMSFIKTFFDMPTGHGAWCWNRLVQLLKSAGHRVTALDLSGSGVDPKRLNQITSFSEYVKPLMELMAPLAEYEKVVLVGHSYGGMAISLATELFPRRRSQSQFM
ncbi:hypothetical protein L484_020271 [Morus notabilis]|uniref:AB hydrolase-1 domain-containing protein n=1 Tax=Morus notabilis TaxID=981085 RepID=W9QRX6_9ROSA|nr:hypothetical protein L484_020271 [Morus notabilis]